MTAPLLRDILEDAKLVAAFGLRAGLLQGTGLFSAIQKVEADPEMGWDHPDAVELQLALGRAIAAIKPVDLIDLRRGWNPFAERPRARGREALARTVALYGTLLLSFVFMLFLGGLMVFAVSLTQWQKRAEYVVALHQEGARERQAALISEIYEQYLARHEATAEAVLREAGSGFRSELRAKIATVQGLQARIWDNQVKYNKVNRQFILEKARFDWLLDLSARLAPAGGAAVPAGVAVGVAGAPPPAGVPPVLPARPGASVYDHCLERWQWERAGTADARGPRDEFQASVAEDQLGISLVRCLTGTDVNIPGTPYDQADLNGKIELVSLWILPALFGALGACFYYLRVILDRLRPTPRLSRAATRVVLGAFGGVAFGWFVSPAATQDLLGVTLPLGAYAIAFLIGYAIDVFYEVIDRLVTVASRAIQRIGVAQPAGERAQRP